MILWYPCARCGLMTASAGPKSPTCDRCRAVAMEEGLVRFGGHVQQMLLSWVRSQARESVRGEDGLIHGRPQPGYTRSGTDRPSSPFRTRRYYDGDPWNPASGGLPSLGRGYS